MSLQQRMADAEFAALTEKISRERGFGCASYKEKCLRRRIAVRMRARGVHTFRDYAAILDRDAREYELLLDALTINVTKLFRNWETFAAIAHDVIPELWPAETQHIRCWSAGCASGEEPYSLAILMHQEAARRRDDAALSRIMIVGSDIDRLSLKAAERGTFGEDAFADTPPIIRRRYFAPKPPHALDPSVKAMVRFERRDLLHEPPPAGGLELITCRNVIIYFDRVSQEALFQRFFDALVPGGFLVLGKVETLLGPTRNQFVAVNPRERIFRKP
ncbi:MAG TPA: protein-glutamate O-methyltransferase CheR [Gemmatimonadaceae bacterium]|nr:protein-glutamate O-methyltransferase CheR [Gemmatimonadaceae bacterium]